MEESKTKNETTEEQEEKHEETNRQTILKDDAGPSRFEDLPGVIPINHKDSYNLQLGISKSEHSVRPITSKDVANALRLTSISFGNANHNIELKKPKLPTLSPYDEKEDDSATLVDLKRFMATCFKFNKQAPNVINEIPNVHAQVATITNELLQNIPNASNFTNQGSINEVVVTDLPTVDAQPKVNANNKRKTSGSLSEKSDFGLAPRDSLSSIGSNVCRICMTKGRERLISPCNCKGSLANVHLTCLERWLNQVGRNHCELCGFSYPAIRTPRYTILQALRLWFGNPRNRSHLQSDCLIFWLLSTVTAGLLAVCIVGTQYFIIEGNNFGKPDASRKTEGISHRITETAMDFFMVIVLCGYSVTVYLLWKDHFVMWNRWRRANVNVRLLLTPDSNPVPFVPRTRYNVV